MEKSQELLAELLGVADRVAAEARACGRRTCGVAPGTARAWGTALEQAAQRYRASLGGATVSEPAPPATP